MIMFLRFLAAHVLDDGYTNQMHPCKAWIGTELGKERGKRQSIYFAGADNGAVSYCKSIQIYQVTPWLSMFFLEARPRGCLFIFPTIWQNT